MEVRWGILGCAGIAQKFCSAVSSVDNARVAAVASRSLEKAKEFAGAHCPGAKAYSSYDELLQDESVQAVYVPVPTGLRTELALKAAAAKKHLLVEKPLVNSKELQSMIEACKKSGVQFMDNTMFPHHDRQLAMRQVLDDQEKFGSPKHVTSTFSIPFGNDASWAQSNIRMDKSLEPLGCLGDLGWYNIRFTLWAFDYANPESVSCSFLQHTPEGVPTHVVANMRFAGNRSASIMCSFLSALHNSAEVIGEKSVLRLDDFVITSALDAASFSVMKTNIGEKALAFPVEVLQREDVKGCIQHAKLVENFSNLVASGKVDETWPERSLQTQVVLDAMVLSASRDGAWVRLEEVDQSESGKRQKTE